MFTRRSRADLAEQKSLRDEITLAYQNMEARVLERTADLEKTTQRLAQENEEREKSDQRTRLILNSVGDGIFGVDLQERGVFFNDAAIRLLGYSAEELMGHEIYRIIHHLRADGSALPEQDCPMHLACAQRQEKHASGEVLWCQDGTSFISQYSVTPIVDSQGNNSGAVIVFRDITEQRKDHNALQERMDELQRFNHLTIGREERMIALKQEVNALLQAAGMAPKYRSAEVNEALATSENSEGGAL
jgi:PAS domain S-box-containing protein